ncbi:MAG TPA: tetratricopeptide repeat protein, partial [Candidatus Obscuribacter sp.]|nr:tetratricopeptide repeat protein [Candidatus Obscuribacter sp.]
MPKQIMASFQTRRTPTFITTLAAALILPLLPSATPAPTVNLSFCPAAAAQGITPQPMPRQFLERYNQGVSYMKSGEVDKALQIFKQVAINAPYDPLVHLSLAEAMHQSGDTDNAIAEYRRALRIRPYDAFARMSLGSLLQARGELQDAVNEYDEAIKLRPDVVLFRLNLGIALRIAGSRDDAITELKKVVQAYPEHLKARAQLAAAYQDKGNFQMASE